MEWNERVAAARKAAGLTQETLGAVSYTHLDVYKRQGQGGAKRKLLACVLGLLLCYAFGTAWFVAVYLQGGKAVSVLSALLLCVVPYLLPDLLKLTLAAVIAKRVG